MSPTHIEAAARSQWHFKDQGSLADNSPTCVQTLWSKTNLTRDSAAGLSKLWSICPNTLGHTVWVWSQSFNQGFISLNIVIAHLLPVPTSFQAHCLKRKKKKRKVKNLQSKLFIFHQRRLAISGSTPCCAGKRRRRWRGRRRRSGLCGSRWNYHQQATTITSNSI